MSLNETYFANVRRTEWLACDERTMKSGYLRGNERSIDSVTWCEREVERLAAKGIESRVKYDHNGHCAVFVHGQYDGYREPVEEICYDDPS